MTRAAEEGGVRPGTRGRRRSVRFRRQRARLAAWLLVGLCGISGGCGPRSPEAVEFVPEGPEFSGRAALAHMRALASHVPREPGSESDLAARAYWARHFEALGAQVATRPQAQRRHLVASLPGRSPASVVLVAAYPSPTPLAGLDDSGAALLLELARVLSLTEPTYTLRFALADTTGATLSGGPAELRQRLEEAGSSLANTFSNSSKEPEALDSPIRAVIAFDFSARPGLRLARDLRSHPVYRTLFWDTARELGLARFFPEDGGWASPRGLHLGFRDQGIDPLLALVDESAARADLLLYAAPAAAEPSAEVFDAVGRVSVEALQRLMQRLGKIDAFVPPPRPALPPASSPSSSP